MKKILKIILFLIFGIILVYTAGWFYGRQYVTSLLTQGHSGKSFTIETIKSPDSIDITGYPFKFQIKTTGTANLVYKSKKNPQNIPFTFTDLSASYSLFTPYQASARIKTITVSMGSYLSEGTSFNISDITASLDYKGENMYGRGPTVILTASAISLAPQVAQCLLFNQNNLQLSLNTNPTSHTNNQRVDWISTIKFYPGCRYLLPPSYQPLVNLIPLKESGFTSKISLRSSKDQHSNKKVNIDFSTETQQKKPLLITSANLLHDPRVNNKDHYNGDLKIIFNQVIGTPMKKKKNSFLNVLATKLLTPLQENVGQYVLDFKVVNNQIMPSKNTLQRLTNFIFN